MRLRATRLTAIATAVRRLFNPASLFATGAPGLWYDLSLTDDALFQDAAGTLPVTAVEQPVGLVLDKSKWLALGPELVTNGDFSSDSAWTKEDVSVSIADGKLIFAGTPSAKGVNQTRTQNTSGLFVKITVNVSTLQEGSLLIAYGGVTRIITQVGASTFYGTTTAAVSVLVRSTGTTTATIDSISVREIPGNHAFQTISANRPVLSARKNRLVGTETLATQNVTVRNVGHVLSFWGTGTVTLSGTSTAGPLVGTGAGNRVYLEFTPTAGTLTLTVSGTVSKAQLEEINETV